MAKKVLVYFSMFVMGIAILIGAAILLGMLDEINENGVVEVVLIDRTEHVIKFEEGGLVPGDERSYIVQLRRADVDRGYLSFDFMETEDTGLKNFARVKVILEEEVLLDELLTDAFEDDRIVMPIDFKKEDTMELLVVYYLPLSVGNEAKNTETVFELKLIASNE